MSSAFQDDREEKFSWFIVHDVEHLTLTLTLTAQTAAPHYTEQRTDLIAAMNIGTTMTISTDTITEAAALVY
jgi:hypothetical protein